MSNTDKPFLDIYAILGRLPHRYVLLAVMSAGRPMVPAWTKRCAV